MSLSDFMQEIWTIKGKLNKKKTLKISQSKENPKVVENLLCFLFSFKAEIDEKIRKILENNVKKI